MLPRGLSYVCIQPNIFKLMYLCTQLVCLHRNTLVVLLYSSVTVAWLLLVVDRVLSPSTPPSRLISHTKSEAVSPDCSDMPQQNLLPAVLPQSEAQAGCLLRCMCLAVEQRIRIDALEDGEAFPRPAAAFGDLAGRRSGQEQGDTNRAFLCRQIS